MPTSKAQLLVMIDEAINGRAGNDSVGQIRRSFLRHIRELLESRQFPLSDADRLDCCAMPYIFQEFNYDDIDWTIRDAKLGHLTDVVEIDVIVWSGGLNRF